MSPADDAPIGPAGRPRRSRATKLTVPSETDPTPAEPARIEEDGSIIAADRVDVRLGAVGRVDATELSVHQGAVGGARADRVTVDQGALGGAIAREVTVSQGVARTLLAQEAHVEQSFVRTLVASEVRTDGPTGIGILIARRVVGDVKVLLDWRGALAFGVAAGVVAGLLGRLRRRGK
jgi:hypothetical protein